MREHFTRRFRIGSTSRTLPRSHRTRRLGRHARLGVYGGEPRFLAVEAANPEAIAIHGVDKLTGPLESSSVSTTGSTGESRRASRCTSVSRIKRRTLRRSQPRFYFLTMPTTPGRVPRSSDLLAEAETRGDGGHDWCDEFPGVEKACKAFFNQIGRKVELLAPFLEMLGELADRFDRDDVARAPVALPSKAHRKLRGSTFPVGDLRPQRENRAAGSARPSCPPTTRSEPAAISAPMPPPAKSSCKWTTTIGNTRTA